MINRKAPGITAGVLALLVAACSGGPSSAGGSATLPSAVAYSHCMRINGVPSFPDPGRNGQVPKAGAQQLGISGSRLQAAQRDCQRLYPSNGGSVLQEEQQCFVAGDCPAALVQRMMTAALRFSRCMRSHGEPDFPDPTGSPAGILFNASAHGISDAMSHSSRFVGELNTCQREAGNFPYSFS